MRVVEHRRVLNSANHLRVKFELDRGRVLKFMVQLECKIDDDWVAVVRYDTAHGFAHCDLLHPYDETVKTRMTSEDYNEAIILALEDLSTYWSAYRRRYEAWLRKG